MTYINGSHDWIECHRDENDPEYAVVFSWHGRGSIVTNIRLDKRDLAILIGLCEEWKAKLKS